MKRNIGIVGCGFVGNAVYHGLRAVHNVNVFDKHLEHRSTVESLDKLVGRSDIVFVCVPTPMMESGECDTSIVESVCRDIARSSSERGKHTTIVIKSTVPPGTTDRLHKQFAECGVSILFSPEFLMEKSAVQDFLEQDRIIIGDGDDRSVTKSVEHMFIESFPDVPVYVVPSTTAETLKYFTNAFLATKVSFANEMFQICEKLGVDYRSLTELVLLDDRIGKTHLQVPGPMPSSDGSGKLLKGFSGSCLLGNSLVTLADGSTRYISNIFEDHECEVISFDEKLNVSETKTVQKATRRQYTGQLLTFDLEIDGEHRSITCTPEHIFPIKRNNQLMLVEANDITSDDELFVVDENK